MGDNSTSRSARVVAPIHNKYKIKYQKKYALIVAIFYVVSFVVVAFVVDVFVVVVFVVVVFILVVFVMVIFVVELTQNVRNTIFNQIYPIITV